jgi:hypothetical protein
MRPDRFVQLLRELDLSAWQSVIEGRSLLMTDDRRLEPGPTNAPNAVIYAPEFGDIDAEGLRRESLADADSILANYYLTHPLSLAGFNHQVAALIDRHGAAAFAAVAGRLPQRTLFVEGGEVLAEPPESPRHRYGVFYELDRPMPDSRLATELRKWLERGEAHERYLGMNVCRYNC